MVLREATDRDAETLVRLVHTAFAEYLGTLDPPSAAHTETIETVRDKLSAGSAVFALIGDEPVGCAFYEPQDSHLYFSRLSVLPAHRNRGVGRALIDRVERRAREQGFEGVRLGVRIQLSHLQSRYERLGYHVTKYVTHSGHTEPTVVLMEKRVMPEDRLPPVPPEMQTPDQQKAAAAFKASRAREVFGPFVPLFRSPELMLLVNAMGEYLRYRTRLPPRLSEFIILITARHWTQQYEWFTHYPIAVKEGLKPDIAGAVAEGRRPSGMDADEELVHQFTTELLANRGVSDATYARAIARFGEQATIEMVGVAGYYTFQSMVMNTARSPLPAGAEPGLPDLPR